METYAKRMTRSSRNRVFAGVCAGTADYLGVDPVLVRVGLVAVTLMSVGSGIVLYLAAWVLMPLEDSLVTSDGGPAASGRNRVLGATLIALGLLGLALNIAFTNHEREWSLHFGSVGPLLVVAAGIVLFAWKRNADANADTYQHTEKSMPHSEGRAAPRRLMRSAKDRKIAGVCAGLANYFDVDATLIRIFWIIAALVFGTGFLLYLIMWFVMPMDSDPDMIKPN